MYRVQGAGQRVGNDISSQRAPTPPSGRDTSVPTTLLNRVVSVLVPLPAHTTAAQQRQRE